MYDFEGLANEIKREKNNVYVHPESYNLLKMAKDTSEINQQASLNQTHVYVGLKQYKARI